MLKKDLRVKKLQGVEIKHYLVSKQIDITRMKYHYMYNVYIYLYHIYPKIF